MSSAEGPTIEASGNETTGYSWRPSTASVGLAGTVAFRNPSASVYHGLTWTGGPTKPSCAGVPIDGEKVNWSGTCTFTQAGTYTFICPVHPTEMKGSISVSAAEAPPGTTPPPGGTTESPLQGTVSEALKLAKSQKGTSVRGSINLSQASAGGKFEALLFAKRSSLSTKGGRGMSQVGRFVSTSLYAGRLSFVVPLKGVARRALTRLEKLSLSVKLVVTPPGRAALTLKRGVVLHD
jgi:plastocyanin